MAKRNRPSAEQTLTDEERVQLVRWSRRAKSSQALALRSRIILSCGEGLSNQAVIAQLGVSRLLKQQKAGVHQGRARDLARLP